MKLYDIGEVPAEGGGGWREEPFTPVLLSIANTFHITWRAPRWCVWIWLNVIHFPVNVLAWPVNLSYFAL